MSVKPFSKQPVIEQEMEDSEFLSRRIFFMIIQFHKKYFVSNIS